MKEYLVQWDYSSSWGGPWVKGQRVSLHPDVAAGCNRDSPGVLIEVGAIEEAAPPNDRMVKRAQHRGQGGEQGAIDRTTFKAVKEK